MSSGKTNWEVIVPLMMIFSIISGGIALWIFQSSVERDVWNRCHPTHQLSLFETMWSTTRIDNCEVPDE